MKSPARRNLRSIRMLRDHALPTRRMLLLSLEGTLVLCGCNKRPPGGCRTFVASTSGSRTGARSRIGVRPGAGASHQCTVSPSPAPMQAAAPPPPPQLKVYTVPSGTTLTIRLSQELNSKTNHVGDPFSGSLAQSVHVQGVTVLKIGAPATGTVVAVRKQGKFKGEGNLGIQLTRIGSYGVTTEEYEQAVKGKGKRSATMVGGGGGGGGLIGGFAGGGRGALIGGLVGAGVGTAGAVATGNKAISIPAESVVSFVSSSPITVTLKPKPADEYLWPEPCGGRDLAPAERARIKVRATLLGPLEEASPIRVYDSLDT